MSLSKLCNACALLELNRGLQRIGPKRGASSSSSSEYVESDEDDDSTASTEDEPRVRRPRVAAPHTPDDSDEKLIVATMELIKVTQNLNALTQFNVLMYGTMFTLVLFGHEEMQKYLGTLKTSAEQYQWFQRWVDTTRFPQDERRRTIIAHLYAVGFRRSIPPSLSATEIEQWAQREWLGWASRWLATEIAYYAGIAAKIKAQLDRCKRGDEPDPVVRDRCRELRERYSDEITALLKKGAREEHSEIMAALFGVLFRSFFAGESTPSALSAVTTATPSVLAPPPALPPPPSTTTVATAPAAASRKKPRSSPSAPRSELPSLSTLSLAPPPALPSTTPPPPTIVLSPPISPSEGVIPPPPTVATTPASVPTSLLATTTTTTPAVAAGEDVAVPHPYWFDSELVEDTLDELRKNPPQRYVFRARPGETMPVYVARLKFGEPAVLCAAYALLKDEPIYDQQRDEDLGSDFFMYMALVLAVWRYPRLVQKLLQFYATSARAAARAFGSMVGTDFQRLLGVCRAHRGGGQQLYSMMPNGEDSSTARMLSDRQANVRRFASVQAEYLTWQVSMLHSYLTKYDALVEKHEHYFESGADREVTPAYGPSKGAGFEARYPEYRLVMQIIEFSQTRLGLNLTPPTQDGKRFIAAMVDTHKQLYTDEEWKRVKFAE